MSETLLAAFGLRFVQALIESSPTLLSGLLVAGILHRMIGPAGTRRLFGAAGWRGLVRSWLLGMFLPVCSLGVLPVARVMRRSGVPGGNVLAFMLVGPLLNPISFLYGLTLAEPTVICIFIVLTLLLALAAGLLWERLFPEANAPDMQLLAAAEAELRPAPGPGRLLAVAVTAARELIGPVMLYVLVAVASTALLSAALPRGILQHTMQPTDSFSPLLMAGIATPAYMGPLPGMMRIGLMFEHGNSVGATFVLFILGIGLNVGLIAWLVRSLGWRPAGAWLGMVIAGTLALAYAIEKPLYPKIEPASHTHAFDDVSSPYFVGEPIREEYVKAKLLEKLDVLESAAMVGLALLALLAGLERVTGLKPRLEAFLTGQPVPEPKIRRRARWDIDIPGPVLGAIALLGLVVFSVISAYVYYPPRKQVFTEMAAVRAEAILAVTHDHRDEAIRRLEQWDLLTRKLQVGEFLRTMHYDEHAAEKADDLREAMEKVRDALIAGETQQAKELLREVEKSYQACREAHRE